MSFQIHALPAEPFARSLALPDDAQFMLDRVPEINGFYGASSMERLPTEISITAQVRNFTAIRRK